MSNPKKDKKARRKKQPGWKAIVPTHKLIYTEVPSASTNKNGEHIKNKDGSVRMYTKKIIVKI